MINPTREQVAVALFNLLQTAGATFQTYSRRLQLWDNAIAMPALYLSNPAEEYVYQHGTATPAHITLEYDVWIYINAGLDPNVIPDTQLNNLIDLIETTIAGTFATNWVQTLGGIVNHAWIEGAPKRFPGYIDGQGGAILTIKVLVPSG